MILVTGGAGFIGSNFIIDWLASNDEPVINLDLLTYAGNVRNLRALARNDRHLLVRGDICDRALVNELFATHRPRAVIHFAAESHVDRSIRGPDAFVRTNIEGTYRLLEAAHSHFAALPREGRKAFRFVHISTDEVYGSLQPSEPAFVESSRYAPNSPYAASKAAADHLVRAWHRTYGLPALTTNCSNNYGPYQLSEKLIPAMIAHALSGERLPIYGDGQHVRDWLYVSDHCAAVREVLAHGRVGETYNVGGWNERTNLEVVQTICSLLDEFQPRSANIGSYSRLVAHVRDRPGHDRRYAIDARKIERELGWRPSETFESGMRKTVRWYLDHTDWLAGAQHGIWHGADMGGSFSAST